VKSLFLNSLEKKQNSLNKRLFRNVVLKKLRKKFSLEKMDTPSRKSLQKKGSFINETSTMMGTTLHVFENLKAHHRSICDASNLQSISREAIEMKYLDQLKEEINLRNKEKDEDFDLMDEKKKKEIENSLIGFKEELQIYKGKIKEQKKIEALKRDVLFRSEVKILQMNQQVNIKKI